MTDLRELATKWLSLAAELGWGVEGPPDAALVTELIEAVARGDKPRNTSVSDIIVKRPLGLRPVDALYESADLILEGVGASGSSREEALSAARGWLEIAASRAP